MKPLLSLLIIYSLAALFGACSEADEPAVEPPLVVEGWIEEDESPLVIVTRAVDLTRPTDDFDNAVERWCRVTVYDGTTPYILSGALDRNYTPPFIYTSSRIKGQAGHTYRLVVETETETATAETVLTAAPRISRLEAVKSPNNDNLYSIRAYINNLPADCYFKFFARSHQLETRSFPTFLGTFSAADYAPECGWTITRGNHGGFNEEGFEHYYASGDRVTVTLCSLQPDLYYFWKAYETATSLSQNLLFTVAHNLPSNIDGALGYWAAYGTSSRAITIP